MKYSMKTNRLFYFLIVISIIILGMLSRKIEAIPLFIGDILYACMIYFIIRFLFIQVKPQKIALISLLICYAIETLQLYQANWIVEIRNSNFGHLVLGQGFLWSDIMAYTFGVGLSFSIERLIYKPSN